MAIGGGFHNGRGPVRLLAGAIAAVALAGVIGAIVTVRSGDAATVATVAQIQALSSSATGLNGQSYRMVLSVEAGRGIPAQQLATVDIASDGAARAVITSPLGDLTQFFAPGVIYTSDPARPGLFIAWDVTAVEAQLNTFSAAQAGGSVLEGISQWAVGEVTHEPGGTHDGVETTLYEADLDHRKVMAASPMGAGVAAQIPEDWTLEVKVWVGADGLMRRLEQKVVTPNADLLNAVSEAVFGLTIEVTTLDAEPDISLPGPDEISDHRVAATLADLTI